MIAARILGHATTLSMAGLSQFRHPLVSRLMYRGHAGHEPRHRNTRADVVYQYTDKLNQVIWFRTVHLHIQSLLYAHLHDTHSKDGLCVVSMEGLNQPAWKGLFNTQNTRNTESWNDTYMYIISAVLQNLSRVELPA